MIGNAAAARIRARARDRHRAERLWEHPAIAGKHVVSMTRDYGGGESYSVATCQCGWISRAGISVEDYAGQDRAIEDHWRDMVACDGVAA